MDQTQDNRAPAAVFERMVDMHKISINKGIEIEVNDKHDILTVNVEDQNFISKYYDMIEKFDDIKKSMERTALKEQGGREQLQHLIAGTKEIMKEIDVVFGEESCKKIFGDIVPNPYLIADFFEQMGPIIKEYTDERKKIIQTKYSRSRKGGTGKR